MVLSHFTNKPNDDLHVLEALKLDIGGKIPENEPFEGEIGPKNEGTAAVDANKSVTL